MIPTSARSVLVIGKKGSGKSRAIKQGLALVPQWMAWDLRGEYADPTIGVAGTRLWTDFNAFLAHVRNGGAIAREAFACPVEQFPDWCKFVFRTGNLLVVIEELSRYCGSGKPIPPLLDLLDRSRHAGIDLIAAAPDLAEIPKGLVRQVDEIVIAKVTEPNSIAFLERWLGASAARRIAALEPEQLLRIRL